MKILLGYHYYPYPHDVKLWVENLAKRLKKSGLEFDTFPLNLNPPDNRLFWNEIDYKWKYGDKPLLTLYEKLAKKLESYDVFVNWNGINLHPDFVRQLPTFNVYGCFDDPESSDNLSKPVAAAYDLSMVGNIAELDAYKSWGVKEVRWWPLGFFSESYNPALTGNDILRGTRDVNMALLCERQYGFREDRLGKLTNAIPNAVYAGPGWEHPGYYGQEKVKLYQRTKIGINIHNSTGPINFRTFELPANGVMQICDCKSNLAKIYELDKEVVGYNTIDEAIELYKYYINHDEERKKIAVAGWERATKDYNEVAVFSLIEKYVAEVQQKNQNWKQNKPTNAVIFLKIKRQKTFYRRLCRYISRKISKTISK